jgi:1-pyrroline-5-carboxylate dehydrogenase
MPQHGIVARRSGLCPAFSVLACHDEQVDAVTAVPQPRNEPVLSYAPGSPERARIEQALKAVAAETVEITLTVDGEQRPGSGDDLVVRAPHRHDLVLARGRASTQADASAAIEAALRAAPAWRELSFDARAAVFLRAADLLAGPWRDRSNAVTMLGQSKTVFQSEIDAACELIDFWRWNVHFAREILAGQPVSVPGVWNRTDHRPLEGFVYAVTPFNFTSIAGNLPTAPALMGNTVVWKPATTQLLAAQATMRLLEEAGLPPGVINLLPGHGAETSAAVLAHPALAGIHFTGSTATFSSLWRGVADNLATYRTYPRLVGETGGKDFVLAHPSADPVALRTALIRGAFEYQGQKCSAASRAFVPRSIWDRMGEDLLAETAALPMGDVTDFSNFLGAVIDDRAYAKLSSAIERAQAGPSTSVLVGGECDDREGYFVRPTIVLSEDPTDEVLCTEYFGPLLGLFVYEDARWDDVLGLVDTGSPYGLTGAVFANDRAAVGQQPFGGSRASGTNDKAGSPLNLLRWVSPRSIKETLVPPTDWRYPHMG